MAEPAARIVRREEVQTLPIGGIGARLFVSAAETDGRFALLEHPMPPRALGSPLHRHSREDEYSYVIAGEIGALLGDEVVTASAGDILFKPRGQWSAST